MQRLYYASVLYLNPIEVAEDATKRSEGGWRLVAVDWRLRSFSSSVDPQKGD